ncbi:MAG: cardiolipin synthase [Crocinitomicaceae bacterium]|nr:cardiolipin synthase [Crocinitomicaceae bacterium]
MELYTFIASIITIIYVFLVIQTIFTILLQNRNPLKTHSYILVLILLPGLGLIVYFFFGMQYRRRKKFAKRKIKSSRLLEDWRNHYLQIIRDNYELLEERFGERIKTPKLLFTSENSILTLENNVEVLRNGEEKFPRLLEDLNAAKDHIHLEYYILSDDDLGNQIIDVLIKKAKEGLTVRVIFDSVGSLSLSNQTVYKMQEAGVKTGEYLPVRFPRFANKLNFRDHRKIIVIDGKIGYCGGINIDKRYDNRYLSENPYYWRDTSLRLEGDVVYELQTMFLITWDFVEEELILPDEKYFPKNEVKNRCLSSVVGSGPESQPKIMMDTFFSLITTAKSDIRIVTPYFIPNESILTAITNASKSGVTVEIILPGVSDSKLVQSATNSFIPPLLEAGVKVYFYQKGFIHAKIMIVDGEIATVGTANMDYRSFEQNSEVNVILYNPEVSGVLVNQFKDDLKESVQVNSDFWQSLSLKQKLFASFARLFSPIL